MTVPRTRHNDRVLLSEHPSLHLHDVSLNILLCCWNQEPSGSVLRGTITNFEVWRWPGSILYYKTIRELRIDVSLNQCTGRTELNSKVIWSNRVWTK